MNRFIVAAVAAAGLALAGSASAATNLIVNGSFENGTPANPFVGWTHTGGDTAGFPAVIITYNNTLAYPQGAFNESIPMDSVSSSPDQVGTHAAYFVGDFSNETLSETLTLAAGTYTLGFDAYAPANGLHNSDADPAGDGHFTATVGGQSLLDANISTLVAQTWTPFRETIVVPAGGQNGDTVFTFSTNFFPSNDVVIDSVFLTKVGGVPEPASWALMILGFGGAGAALRSRRRQAVAA
jgi:PEP-CTERM motif